MKHRKEKLRFTTKINRYKMQIKRNGSPLNHINEKIGRPSELLFDIHQLSLVESIQSRNDNDI